MPIIAIDGLDGSGKKTQTGLLVDELKARHEVFTLDFPRYQHPSSMLVREHLAGRTSMDATTENPYAVASYYACDRFVSYQNEWRKHYENNEIIVFDRYTTANMIHQTVKLPPERRPEFLAWLYDYEHVKLGIPKPDVVLYLDVPPETARKLILERYGGDESRMDKLESDLEYQSRCRNTARLAARLYDWTVISCETDGRLLSEQDIHERIMTQLKTKG